MTRSELVRQARQGDRDAYDILLTEVVDHLYRLARLILRRGRAVSRDLRRTFQQTHTKEKLHGA